MTTGPHCPACLAPGKGEGPAGTERYLLGSGSLGAAADVGVGGGPLSKRCWGGAQNIIASPGADPTLGDQQPRFALSGATAAGVSAAACPRPSLRAAGRSGQNVPHAMPPPGRTSGSAASQESDRRLLKRRSDVVGRQSSTCRPERRLPFRPLFFSTARTSAEILVMTSGAFEPSGNPCRASHDGLPQNRPCRAADAGHMRQHGAGERFRTTGTDA